MYRLLAQIHAWIGLIASAFLAIFALSGTILVYRNEIIALSLPNNGSIAILDNEAAIAKIFGSFDIGKIKSITMPNSDLPFYKIAHEKQISYFDISGTLVETSRELQRFDEWLFNLHHYLLMGKVGEPFVGAIGAFCLFMVIIGIYLWFRAWRQFRFQILPQSIKRRDIISHHRNIGIVFALPLLLVASTGTSMIFDDVAKAAIGVFTGATPKPIPSIHVTKGQISPEAVIGGMKIAKQEFPDAQIRYISLPKKASEPINYRMRQKGELHPNGRTMVRYDFAIAKIAGKVDAQQLDATSRIYNAVYPLHSGRFGNAFYKFLLSLTGVALFVLSILSAFSFGRHILRPKKKSKNI